MGKDSLECTVSVEPATHRTVRCRGKDKDTGPSTLRASVVRDFLVMQGMIWCFDKVIPMPVPATAGARFDAPVPCPHGGSIRECGRNNICNILHVSFLERHRVLIVFCPRSMGYTPDNSSITRTTQHIND